MATGHGLAGDVPGRGQGPLRRQAPPAGGTQEARRGRRLTPVSTGAPSGKILDAGFFDRETVAVARDLLGKVLVREVDGRKLWGRLVEVEAYMGPD
ncbi:MAG TPA: DNA-3-methyladenine glycosylase, partial [Candidatus Eisenbacteria bacterium]|nr:DNA-3-methyladenine glycosylase [Candidatus Eisenbacteria bacterium]